MLQEDKNESKGNYLMIITYLLGGGLLGVGGGSYIVNKPDNAHYVGNAFEVIEDKLELSKEEHLRIWRAIDSNNSHNIIEDKLNLSKEEHMRIWRAIDDLKRQCDKCEADMEVHSILQDLKTNISPIEITK